MRHFTRETAADIMTNQIKAEDLAARYPEYQGEVLRELETARASGGRDLTARLIDRATAASKLAGAKIESSDYNPKTVDQFLPEIIKSRLVLYVLQQYAKTVKTADTVAYARLAYYERWLLQRLLFERDFVRKPVSRKAFNFWWLFVKNKKSLMPLLNDKGVYCFFTKELISGLAGLIGGRKCLEIGAGDGTLTKFLTKEGVDCKATDDYSWRQYITYPDFVEKADAKAALRKYRPQAVLCSWPVPKNAYEKHVFNSDSVELYIMIGTKNPQITGNFDLYNNLSDFSRSLDEGLSALLLPPSGDNAVYVFRRNA